MAKKIDITTVDTKAFAPVFACYPELKFDLVFLTNDNRDLIVQFRVRAGFTFDTTIHGRILSAWLGEKVGEYRQVSFDSFDGGVIIIYKALRNYKYELIKAAETVEV